VQRGGSEVLEEFDFAIEMHDEGLVFGLGQHVIQELLAGGALFVEDIALAQAGVDQQAESERQIFLLREVADGLRTAILCEGEVVFRQRVDDGAVLVPDGNRQGHDFDLHRHGGGHIALLGVLGEQKRISHEQAEEGGSKLPLHTWL
jgi:hypothetical protein